MKKQKQNITEGNNNASFEANSNLFTINNSKEEQEIQTLNLSRPRVKSNDIDISLLKDI